jgi:hypothetical protein
MTAFQIVVSLLSIAAIVRILSFQRRGSRFRRDISMVAWLIVVALGHLLINAITRHLHADLVEASLIIAALTLFNLFIYHRRGNVAPFIGD